MSKMKRGYPEYPYLCEADCIVDEVMFNNADKSLFIKIEGIVGQKSMLKIITTT